LGDAAIEFIRSGAHRDIANQAIDDRVGRLPVGLGRVSGDEAMPQNRLGDGANIVD
jgi:hypothetical protein